MKSYICGWTRMREKQKEILSDTCVRKRVAENSLHNVLNL